MDIYFFVASAVFSVIPILVIFKINIQKLIENPNQLSEIQRKFLIGVALSKVVPVILLIVGIINMSTVDLNSLYVPLTIIVIVVAIGFFYISSQRNVDVNEDVKIAVNTLTFIAKPLIFSIPLMATVFMIMMTL